MVAIDMHFYCGDLVRVKQTFLRNKLASKTGLLWLQYHSSHGMYGTFQFQLRFYSLAKLSQQHFIGYIFFMENRNDQCDYNFSKLTSIRTAQTYIHCVDTQKNFSNFNTRKHVEINFDVFYIWIEVNTETNSIDFFSDSVFIFPKISLMLFNHHFCFQLKILKICSNWIIMKFSMLTSSTTFLWFLKSFPLRKKKFEWTSKKISLS